MKGLLYATLGGLVIAAVAARSGWAADKPATPKYEKMLYELGAFPLAKLTRSYWQEGGG